MVVQMVGNDVQVYTFLFVWSVSHSWKCCLDVAGQLAREVVSK